MRASFDRAILFGTILAEMPEMPSRRIFTLAALASAACAASGCGVGPCFEAAARRFGSSHSRLATLAAEEGRLRIDAATGPQGWFETLLDTFRRRYPRVVPDYRRPTSSELDTNFRAEVAAARPTADILISSAMNLQFKLVNDCLARAYESIEKPKLPTWAVWKDEAYAITAEPIVFVYNRALMPANDVPLSHGDLADLLRRKAAFYRQKIATYDPARSATGYLYFTEDLMVSGDTLDFIEAVGRTDPTLYVSGGDANRSVEKGGHLLAYNMVGSYALEAQSADRHLAVIYPSDYTLVASHIALIPTTARHPAAGELFLDFLLSEEAQSILARHFVRPIRDGLSMAGPAPPPGVLRPIRFGPSLLASLDEYRRRSVLRSWQNALQP